MDNSDTSHNNESKNKCEDQGDEGDEGGGGGGGNDGERKSRGLKDDGLAMARRTFHTGRSSLLLPQLLITSWSILNISLSPLSLFLSLRLHHLSPVCPFISGRRHSCFGIHKACIAQRRYFHNFWKPTRSFHFVFCLVPEQGEKT